MAVKIQISGQDKVVADVIPTGLITLISGDAQIYTGSAWLDCDGSAVSRTAYADLFTVIGTIYGPGDGSTTFNLPNVSSIITHITTVSANKTFSAFFTETVVTVDNSSSMYIDISAGADKNGTRLTVIHKTTTELKIYTDAGHTQECVMPKGMIVLEWDEENSQWCLVGEAVRILVAKTSTTTWKTPFGAVYKLSPVGGGGGGGGAYVYTSGTANAGGGAGGSCQQVVKYETAGTTLDITIGAAGAGGDTNGSNGTNGGNTSINDGTETVYGMGGGGGKGASAGMGSTVYGNGGVASPITTLIAGNIEMICDGKPGTSSGSGVGGNGACGAGKGGSGNGGNGSDRGAGGSGGAQGSDGGHTGGGGTGGVAYIEY